MLWAAGRLCGGRFLICPDAGDPSQLRRVEDRGRAGDQGPLLEHGSRVATRGHWRVQACLPSHLSYSVTIGIHVAAFLFLSNNQPWARHECRLWYEIGLSLLKCAGLGNSLLTLTAKTLETKIYFLFLSV